MDTSRSPSPGRDGVCDKDYVGTANNLDGSSQTQGNGSPVGPSFLPSIHKAENTNRRQGTILAAANTAGYNTNISAMQPAPPQVQSSAQAGGVQYQLLEMSVCHVGINLICDTDFIVQCCQQSAKKDDVGCRQRTIKPSPTDCQLKLGRTKSRRRSSNH